MGVERGARGSETSVSNHDCLPGIPNVQTQALGRGRSSGEAAL
jgi:hypothetical protein